MVHAARPEAHHYAALLPHPRVATSRLHVPARDSMLARLWRRIAAWRARQHSIRALARLDERMLRDIGMHRSEIPAVVDGLLGAGRSL